LPSHAAPGRGNKKRSERPALQKVIQSVLDAQSLLLPPKNPLLKRMDGRA